MKSISGASSPLRSKISLLYVLLAIFGPCMVFAAAVLMAVVFRRDGFDEISISLAVHLMWIFPLIFLAAAICGYPAIRVTDTGIDARNILKNRQFLRSDITGYTETGRFRQGNGFTLSFRNGKHLKIQASYYRNYRELQQALTAGVEWSPELKATLDKEEAKQILQWLGMLFGVSLLFLLYIQLRLGALPLEARDLQRLEVVLAEKPVFIQEEENGEPVPVRLVLSAREFPGIEFQLKGAALWATPIAPLEPGDSLTLFAGKMDYYYAIVRRDHPLIRLKAVDIYAIDRGKQAILSLKTYHAALKAHLEYLRKQGLLALAIVGVLLGWRGWQGKRI
ncbi:MAG: hypothetical protein WA004_11030 [Saprospiraceae bacterium]